MAFGAHIARGFRSGSGGCRKAQGERGGAIIHGIRIRHIWVHDAHNVRGRGRHAGAVLAENPQRGHTCP
eukprot:6177376-Prorocentrum_lima.AAC.1